MIFIKQIIIKTRTKISSLPKIENDITIFAFTKPSKFLIVILEQVAPPHLPADPIDRWSFS